MDWGNVIITKKNDDGSMVAKLNLEGDFKKTKHKLTWLADTKDVVPVDLVDFDHLITKDRLEEDESFEDFLTPQTEFHTDAIADLNVKDMKIGDIIQFERKGYYRLDALPKDGKPYVFLPSQMVNLSTSMVQRNKHHISNVYTYLCYFSTSTL